MPADSGGTGGYTVTIPKITNTTTVGQSNALVKSQINKNLSNLMGGLGAGFIGPQNTPPTSQGVGWNLMRSQYGYQNAGAGGARPDLGNTQTAWQANEQYDALMKNQGYQWNQMRSQYNNAYGGIGAGGSSAATRFGQGIAQQRQQYQRANIGAGGTRGYAPTPEELNAQGLAQKRDEYNALGIGAGGGLFNKTQSMYDWMTGGGGGAGIGGGSGHGRGGGAGRLAAPWFYGTVLWRI